MQAAENHQRELQRQRKAEDDEPPQRRLQLRRAQWSPHQHPRQRLQQGVGNRREALQDQCSNDGEQRQHPATSPARRRCARITSMPAVAPQM